MNNLIEERDKRTERRKKYKRKVDSMFNLSYKDEKEIHLSANVQKLADSTIRLLDEGARVGDDYIDFIIKKGTLEKFLNGNNEYLTNLTPDFIGTVNLGHMDFATFPFIIGEWTANDLSLVDIGDERKGLDVRLNLDSDSVFVKELQRQPYDIGISSEFYYHVDWESTDKIGYLVIDEVYIFAYGLVGECGNVNSSGLELKGDAMAKEELNLNEEEKKKKKKEELNLNEEALEEVIEEETEVIEEVAEVPEDIEEEKLSASEETEETSEESKSEEESEEELDETEADETDLDEVLEEIEQLRAENADLKEQVESLSEANAELKKTNKKLSKKLSAEKEKKEAFIKNAKGISVKLGINEKSPEDKGVNAKFALGDGIGEL